MNNKQIEFFTNLLKKDIEVMNNTNVKNELNKFYQAAKGRLDQVYSLNGKRLSEEGEEK